MNKKVLHICNGFQLSNLYLELFEKLQEVDVHQTVIAPVFISDYKNRTISTNIDIKYFFRDNSFFSRLLFDRKISKLFKFINNSVSVSNIDIVHAHSLFSDGAVAYKLFRQYGIPYIVAVRNTDVNVFFKYFIHKRNLGLQIMNNAQKVIFISNPYKDFVLNNIVLKHDYLLIKSKSLIIPNGVNDYWHNNRCVKKRYNKEFNFIFVGEIQKNKNITLVIDAICRLRTKGYNINFTVVGKGLNDDLNYLRRIEKIASYNEFIKIINKQPASSLISLYKSMDAFIMVSHKETFGLVYVEALLQGLPIIYTRGQGFDGFFDDGSVGVSVLSNDICDIERGVLTVFRDYEKISNNIKDADFSGFRWDNIAKIYYQIYNDISDI